MGFDQYMFYCQRTIDDALDSTQFYNHTTGVVIECTLVCLLLYNTKGKHVGVLGLVDIHPSVPGSRPVAACPTV